MWEERQRTVLFEGTSALERTSASLMRAEQSAIESENIGTNVISELASQREALIRTSNRLEEIDSTLTKSQAIIKFMKRGVIMNKISLITIIIIEIAILAAVIYIRFIKK